MPVMQRLSEPLVNVISRQRKRIGALCLCLILPACASTDLSQPVEVIVLQADCPTLEMDKSLLVVSPVTPVASIETNGNLEDALEVVIADHNRDRGQLQQLVGAEKQREADQTRIDKDCEARANARKAEIEKASRDTVKVNKPIWSRLGIF